jgi:hypothetical protein
VTTGGAPSIVRITYSGSGNFVVRSYDADNNPINTMVNTIGAYEGVLPLDLLDRERTTRLQIQARGAWEVEILPLTQARRLEAPATAVGRGDDVLIVLGNSDTAAITHSGSSNFVVYGYSESGRQLMVNEIGAYQGVKILPARFFLFTIKADGDWEIAVTVR